MLPKMMLNELLELKRDVKSKKKKRKILKQIKTTTRTTGAVNSRVKVSIFFKGPENESYREVPGGKSARPS